MAGYGHDGATLAFTCVSLQSPPFQRVSVRMVVHFFYRRVQDTILARVLAENFRVPSLPVILTYLSILVQGAYNPLPFPS